MRTEAVVDGTVVHGEKNVEEKHQCLFGSNISADSFYAFLQYRPLSGDGSVLKVSFMPLVYIDAQIATVLTCVKQR